MGIFRRSPGAAAPHTEAIARFWEWWPQARRKLDDGVPADIADEMSAHVEAIHSDLQWEIGPGPSLILSGGGDGELRGIAERWRAAAPDDGTWKYLAARPADPAMLSGKRQVERP